MAADLERIERAGYQARMAILRLDAETPDTDTLPVVPEACAEGENREAWDSGVQSALRDFLVPKDETVPEPGPAIPDPDEIDLDVEAAAIPPDAIGAVFVTIKTEIEGRILDLRKEKIQGIDGPVAWTRFQMMLRPEVAGMTIDPRLDDLIPEAVRGSEGSGVLVAWVRPPRTRGDVVEPKDAVLSGSEIFREPYVAAALIEDYVQEQRVRAVMSSVIPPVVDSAVRTYLQAVAGRPNHPVGRALHRLRGGAHR